MTQKSLPSTLLRIATILAVIASITFYVKGGNNLKLQAKEIKNLQSTISDQSKTIELQENKLNSLQNELKQSQTKLLQSERNLQLKDTELLVSRQQLQKNRTQITTLTEDTKKQIVENKRLKRETIELKTRKPIEPKDKQRLLDKIEKQQSIIEQLDSDLNESYLVLETLFPTTAQTTLSSPE